MEVSPAIVQEFVQETLEILQRVSAHLDGFERGSGAKDDLNAIYRDMHTLKGSAQLLGFKEIGALAHALESSLDPIRKLGVRPSRPLLDTIYSCLSLIDAMIKDTASGSPAPSRTAEIEPLVGALIDRTSRLFGGDYQPLPDRIPGLSENKESLAKASRASAPAAAKLAPTPEPAPAAPAPAETAAPEAPKAPAATEPVETSIRVNVALLDRLMNLVGEMVLVRNQVIQRSNKSEDLSFVNLSQRLDAVTNELQDQIMRTRMQPIGNVLGNFQRLVRELAKDLGKRIDLTVQGKDTELDKTLLEAIKDPLTHIVRNSCDHGIEKPEQRRKAGKPETGHILVSAFHEGGQVTVEISDDGNGLNRDKILKKALERGLVAPDRAASITDRDVYQLIFQPGFSTADQVSAVSGRGVGMDVVKTNVERIGGTVELSSVPGRGSTIRLRVPLTLAIVPIMLVRSGEESFAVPQVNLVELVRAGTTNANARVEILQGQPVLRLRGNLLPLVELSALLGGPAAAGLESEEVVNVVVVRAEGQPFGLIVDEVSDTAEIVVKPLGKFLKALDVYSGATILGNGDVALILDVAGIARKCQLGSEKREEHDFLDEKASQAASEIMEYLVFRLRGEGRFCVPLCLVQRLEEFPRASVERPAGRQPVVQYRGSILPLLDLGEALALPERDPPGETVPVIVMKKGERYFGLEVAEILDVIQSDTIIEEPAVSGTGALGNLLEDGRLYVIVDALTLIEREFFGGDGARSEAPPARQHQEAAPRRPAEILYVEDVAFFRKQVGKTLEKAGYTVTTAPDGQAALEILRARPNDFKLILSDIEMPRMNGLEFARSVRATKELRELPMIALTTRFQKRDIEEGLRCGFDSYLEKLNPEVLIGEVQSRIDGIPEAKKHGTR